MFHLCTQWMFMGVLLLVYLGWIEKIFRELYREGIRVWLRTTTHFRPETDKLISWYETSRDGLCFQCHVFCSFRNTDHSLKGKTVEKREIRILGLKHDALYTLFLSGLESGISQWLTHTPKEFSFRSDCEKSWIKPWEFKLLFIK